jgi:hypothetical protein
MLRPAFPSIVRATRRFLVGADGAGQVATVAATSFADAAAAYLETSAAPLEEGELSVTVEDVATGERQAITFDLA